MQNDPLYEKYRELAWRRSLSGAEQEELRRHLRELPDLKSDWDLESALNNSLRRLPDAPVPSNFTARVLAAVDRERAFERRQAEAGRWRFWRRWLPRTAVATAVLGLGVAFYARVQVQENYRADLVESVATVAEVSALPGPEILADFEAIRAMSQTPPADEQLLTLLQ